MQPNYFQAEHGKFQTSSTAISFAASITDTQKSKLLPSSRRNTMNDITIQIGNYAHKYFFCLTSAKPESDLPETIRLFTDKRAVLIKVTGFETQAKQYLFYGHNVRKLIITDGDEFAIYDYLINKLERK